MSEDPLVGRNDGKFTCMVKAKTYEVAARRWAQGWELHVADVGVTQCQPLADADRMARDYLATELGGEPEDYAVDIRPDPAGCLEQERE